MATEQTTDTTKADDTAWLSEEERAALAEGDETAELDEIIGEDGEDGEADDKTDGDDKAEGDDAAAGADDKADDGTKVDDTPAAEDAPALKDDKPDFVPRMDDSPVENYDQKMADIATKRDDLVGKLDSGDIDLKEFVTQDRALSKEETDLKLSQRDAVNAAKYNQGVEQQRWEWEQKKFFDADDNKIYSTDQKMQAELDKAVKYLAFDPVNSDKDGEWFLKEADALVRTRFASAFGTKKQDESAVDTQKKETKAPERKPDLSKIPKTLSDLPAAQNEEEVAGEFSYLNNLEGLALERELAKIAKDPEKEARFLRS